MLHYFRAKQEIENLVSEWESVGTSNYDILVLCFRAVGLHGVEFESDGVPREAIGVSAGATAEVEISATSV